MASRKTREIFELLASGTEDVNFRSSVSRLTPLLAACTSGKLDVKVITALVQAGADCNVIHTSGRLPLHWVATVSEGGAAVLPILISGGADVNARSDEGATAFEVSAVCVCVFAIFISGDT